MYLEQNAISIIENLDKLVNLRCLYLGKNVITEISGLSALTVLETLDLADNAISRLEGLSCLPMLRTLNVSGNRLRSLDDIAELRQCSGLSSLDISSNKLEGNDTVDLMLQLPLLYLKFMGNPAVSTYKCVGLHGTATPHANRMQGGRCCAATA